MQCSRKADYAKMVLFRADGLTPSQIAQKLNCSSKRVSRWLARFRKKGIKSLGIAFTDENEPEIESTRKTTKHKTSSRITMRRIAEKANVSTMTVSRVFNNHPHVRSQLRVRILKIAKEAGYRPDPELSKLMLHLRKQKESRFQGIICSLEAQQWGAEDDDYFRPLVTGAKEQAEALGFGWQTSSLEEFLNNPKHFSRMWYNRGVEGILLPPASYQTRDQALPLHSYWDRFSVVAATYSIPYPTFHRVVPNHFKNINLVCQKLTEQGYQRIGLVIPESLDQRGHHHFSGGFAAFHLSTSKAMIPPFLYDKIGDASKLRRWLELKKPDALIVSSGKIAQNIIQQLKSFKSARTAIAAIALPGKGAGIDELPKEIGAKSIELIASMIVHRNTGLPTHPTVLMIEGIWNNKPAILSPSFRER